MPSSSNTWEIIQNYFISKVLRGLKLLQDSEKILSPTLIDRIDFFLKSCPGRVMGLSDDHIAVQYNALIDSFSISEIEGDLDIAKYCKQFLEPIYCDEHIVSTLETGRNNLKLAFGRDVKSPFELFTEHPKTLESFSRNLFKGRIQECLKSIDLLPQAKTHLDIGGGPGAIAFALNNSSQKDSIEKFDIYELPAGVESLSKIFRSSIHPALPPTWLSYRAGSFLHKTSTFHLQGLGEAEKYEQVHLGLILHDWNDTVCASILSRVKNHLKKNGLLVVHDFVRGKSTPASVGFFDIMMLLAQGGRERSFLELYTLLEGSGFHSVELVDTPIDRKLVLAKC